MVFSYSNHSQHDKDSQFHPHEQAIGQSWSSLLVAKVVKTFGRIFGVLPKLLTSFATYPDRLPARAVQTNLRTPVAFRSATDTRDASGRSIRGLDTETLQKGILHPSSRKPNDPGLNSPRYLTVQLEPMAWDSANNLARGKAQDPPVVTLIHSHQQANPVFPHVRSPSLRYPAYPHLPTGSACWRDVSASENENKHIHRKTHGQRWNSTMQPSPMLRKSQPGQR